MTAARIQRVRTTYEHSHVEFIPTGVILHISLPAAMKAVCETKCSVSCSLFLRSIVTEGLLSQKHRSVLRFVLVSVQKEHILYAVLQG